MFPQMKLPFSTTSSKFAYFSKVIRNSENMWLAHPFLSDYIQQEQLNPRKSRVWSWKGVLEYDDSTKWYVFYTAVSGVSNGETELVAIVTRRHMQYWMLAFVSCATSGHLMFKILYM